VAAFEDHPLASTCACLTGSYSIHTDCQYIGKADIHSYMVYGFGISGISLYGIDQFYAAIQFSSSHIILT